MLAKSTVVTDLSSAFDLLVHDDAADWAAEIPKLIWLQGAQVAAFAGTGPMVTDDRPLPEYFLLRHLFGPPSPQISQALLESPTTGGA